MGKLVDYRTKYCKEKALNNASKSLLNDRNKLSEESKQEVADILSSEYSVDEKIEKLNILVASEIK